MVKSSRFKSFLIEYRNSLLVGSCVLLGLVALASTAHYVITMASVLFLVSVFIYLLIRSTK